MVPVCNSVLEWEDGKPLQFVDDVACSAVIAGAAGATGVGD